MSQPSRDLRGAGPEEGLLSSAQAGDRESFDVLMSRYRPTLEAYLRKRVGSQEVDDILQDCALAAWRALPSYKRRSRFKTWLVAVANFKLQDHFRRRKAPTIAIQDLPNDMAAENDSIEGFEARHLVRPILESLAPPKGAILDLYYGQSMTFGEIAKHLGMNTSTVKYHFYQAHDAVARAIGRNQ